MLRRFRLGSLELLVALSIATLTALHDMSSIDVAGNLARHDVFRVPGREPVGGAAASDPTAVNWSAQSEVVARYRALFRGESPRDVQQTRPLVPAMVEVMSRVGMADRYVVFLVQILSAFVAVWGFAVFAGHYLAGGRKLIAVLLFGVFALSTQKEIARLGDLLAPGLFFSAVSLLRAPSHWLPAVGVFLVGGALRPDFLVVAGVTGAVDALFRGAKAEAVRAVVLATLSAAVMGFVFLSYGLKDLSPVMLGASDGNWRIAQLATIGTWLTLLSFLNILCLAPRRPPPPGLTALWTTGAFSVVLFAVANAGEYRLWLPFAGAAIVWLVSGWDEDEWLGDAR